MSSAYVINGPTNIGNAGQLNTINGNVTLPNIGTAQGTVYYADVNGNLAALVPSTSGLALLTQGPGANPIWGVGHGTDESATLFKSGNQTIGPGPASSIITGYTSVPAAPEYNTGSFNATTGVFTALATFKYQFNVQISYINTTDNSGTRTLTLLRNGVATATSTPIQPTGAIADNQVLMVNITLLLNAGDTISAQFATAGLGGSSNVVVQGGTGTWFAGRRIAF
jgi:hypothetical protein